MKAAVIDASVALKWVQEEPGSDIARGLQRVRFCAPAQLFAECGNALWRLCITGQLSQSDAEARMTALGLAPIERVPSEQIEADALRLACVLRHPIYDCLYLTLAAARRIPFVTADKKLVDRVRREAWGGAEVVWLFDLASPA